MEDGLAALHGIATGVAAGHGSRMPLAGVFGSPYCAGLSELPLNSTGQHVSPGKLRPDTCPAMACSPVAAGLMRFGRRM